MRSIGTSRPRRVHRRHRISAVGIAGAWRGPSEKERYTGTVNPRCQDPLDPRTKIEEKQRLREYEWVLAGSPDWWVISTFAPKWWHIFNIYGIIDLLNAQALDSQFAN
jgi:hypothetical protein